MKLYNFQRVSLHCTEQESLSFKTFEGEVEIGSQYHYYMETLTHVVRPIENGEFEVFPNTQWMHSISVFVANVLNIAAHKIDVKVIIKKWLEETLFFFLEQNF